MEQELSKEIISAEIVFSQQYDMSKIALPENKYSQELSSINESLEKYANHADRYDYMVAVASGILCGVLDAQVADVSSRIIKSKNLDSPAKWKELMSSLLKKVEKDQRKMSMAGMLCSILGKCLNKKADGVLIKNEETGDAEFDAEKAFNVYGNTVVSAVLGWLAADKNPKDIDDSDFPEPVKKMLHQLNNQPKVRKFLKNPRIPEINGETLSKYGVPALFICIVESELPKLNQSLKKAKSKASDFVRSKKP